MCGRYTITVTLEELMMRFMIDDANMPFHTPRYNVAPGQLVPAIIGHGGQARLGELKWGLVPAWAEDAKIGYKMINARAETLREKTSFRTLFSRKRCLIPADGFYEWMTVRDAEGNGEPEENNDRRGGNGRSSVRAAGREASVIAEQLLLPLQAAEEPGEYLKAGSSGKFGNAKADRLSHAGSGTGAAPAKPQRSRKKAAARKQPMRITLGDGGLFAMAGLYDTWLDEQGNKLHTCTVITTRPNALMEPIHDRMPVILRQEDELRWLDRQYADLDRLYALLQPYPAERMRAYPVSPAVGSAACEGPELAEPWEENG